MGKVTVYCPISGCTPEIACRLFYLHFYERDFGPVVKSALKALADPHEITSQDDLCVIGPIHPSGQPYRQPFEPSEPRVIDLHPETAIRVVPRCVMGDVWDFGSVEPPNVQEWYYLVSHGCYLMVQTYALDIMALATRGRMTPLRLWRLAMQQGFEDLSRPYCLEGVEYGEITGQEEAAGPFPGFSRTQFMELERIGDAEAVKERIMHEGLFWVWMAPDRFPVAPTKGEYPAPAVPEVRPCRSRSAIESLPPEVLAFIVSSLPLRWLFNLASASCSLRTEILGNDHCARVWLYNSAPWWIPVPTQTPRKRDESEPSTTVLQVYLASHWSAHTQIAIQFPVGLDWAYSRRCVRSGSMRNRRRI